MHVRALGVCCCYGLPSEQWTACVSRVCFTLFLLRAVGLQGALIPEARVNYKRCWLALARGGHLRRVGAFEYILFF